MHPSLEKKVISIWESYSQDLPKFRPHVQIRGEAHMRSWQPVGRSEGQASLESLRAGLCSVNLHHFAVMLLRLSHVH